MPYHVCHKCGLPRKVTEPDEVDLGGCECLGQSVFEFEEKPRTRDEAIQIGVSKFLDILVLYMRQKRTEHEIAELVQKYSKVLGYRAVYRVKINS